MRGYYLLVHPTYETTPERQRVTLTREGRTILLGPGTSDLQVLAKGHSSSYAYHWHWSVVHLDAVDVDLVTDKDIRLFPFLEIGGTHPTQTGKPTAVPIVKMSPSPTWAREQVYSQEQVRALTPFVSIDCLSSLTECLAAGIPAQPHSEVQYSVVLSFNGLHSESTTWRKDVRLESMGRLLYAHDFTTAPTRFDIFEPFGLIPRRQSGARARRSR